MTECPEGRGNPTARAHDPDIPEHPPTFTDMQLPLCSATATHEIFCSAVENGRNSLFLELLSFSTMHEQGCLHLVAAVWSIQLLISASLAFWSLY
jgi:hypothetical protein